MADLYGILDFGSNSVKVLIAQKVASQKSIEGFPFLPIKTQTFVTRLGKGLNEKSRSLNSEAIKKTHLAIDQILNILTDYNVPRNNLLAFGTAALRFCSDPTPVSVYLKKKIGIDLNIISGNEEASFSFLAAARIGQLFWKNKAPFFLCEIGGASTQIGTSDSVESFFSIPVGAVRIFESQVAAKSVLSTQPEYSSLGSLKSKNPTTHLVCVGGSLLLAAKICPASQEYRVDKELLGYSLDSNSFKEFFKIISSQTLEDRKKITGMDPDRADILPAALDILGNILDVLNIDQVLVTPFGLRHGALLSFLSST